MRFMAGTDANPGPKLKLNITADDSAALLNSIKGKVLGQKISFTAVP